MIINSRTAIYIFTGHYGSGKTETSIAFARMLKERTDHKVALIDLDIVNPFFRSADAKEALMADGIRVEVPLYANTNVDIPALTGNMGALIEDSEYDVVLDVGGDDLGAKAVGRYSDEISKRPHMQYFVVNERRPFTGDIAGASKAFDEVQSASLLKHDGVINNTNLLQHTTASTIIEGISLCKELCAVKKVPLCYHVVEKRLVDDILALNNPDITRDNMIIMEREVRRLF